jgi:hypothetical protein
VKVKELIAELSKMDLEAEILTRDYDHWYYDIEHVTEKRINIEEGQEQKETDDMPTYVILGA